MEQKIELNLLETSDYDTFLEVTYNGAPFTGIGYEETKLFYSEYRYENGFGHGRCFSVYHSGQLMEELFVEHGKVLSTKYWYPSGQIREREKDGTREQWFENGNLYRKADHDSIDTYYESGELKSHSILKHHGGRSYGATKTTYYGKDGAFLFEEQYANTQPDAGYIKISDARWLKTNDDAMAENFHTLCEEYTFLVFLDSWVAHLLQTNRDKGLQHLTAMLQHDNLRAKDRAITLCAREHVKEALPLLQAAQADNRKPPNYYEPCSSRLSITWSRTIAEQAAYAINAINKSSN